MADSTLGERLRDLRVNGPGGYRSLRTAAKALDWSFVRLSKVENNRERPERDELVRAAAILSGDLGELLRLWDEWQEAPPIDLSANICHKRWT